MRNHNKYCHVANVELTLDIVDEGREANDSIHGHHQDTFIEEFYFNLRFIHENISSDDHCLGNNLSDHQRHLPDKLFPYKTNSHSNYHSAKKEETGYPEYFHS